MQTLQQGNQELGIVIIMDTFITAGIIATGLDSYKKVFRNVFP